MARGRCRVCGEERDQVVTCELVGQSDHAYVEMSAFPYRTCRHHHEKVYVYPDFGSDLHEFVFNGPGLPLTCQKRRLLRGPEICRACGYAIPSDAPEHDHDFVSEPKLGSAPAFSLRYTAPAITCARCATPQVRVTQLRRIDPAEAMAAAFDSVGVRPT
jgi:hypothetical protein